MKSIFKCLTICLLMNACSNPVEKNKIGEIRSVVIIGNSIVHHGSLPAIGWTNNWGMAASAKDSDFVHLLMREIHLVDPSVVFRFVNIADFERHYAGFDLNTLDSLKDPDMLIMRIAENVKDTISMEGFITAYGKLVNYLGSTGKTVKIITDSFWENPHINKAIKKYAKENHFAFIALHDISNDSAYTAKGLFENEGVAFHPGNKGMREIAGRIWKSIKVYFPEKN